MTDPRTERIELIARELSRLDTPHDLTARRSYLRARDHLSALIRAHAPDHVIDVHRRRVQRAQEVLTAVLHPVV